MKLIKRHMGLAIVCILTLVLIGILYAIFSRMFFSNDKTEYGDRLNNIVEIDKSTLDEAKSKIAENELVENVTIRTQGKIIYTVMNVTEKCTKDKAKEIAEKSIEYYEKDVIECYDFEFIINLTIETDDEEEKEDKSFTIAGTKSPNNEKISWTRN